ncbi:MAG: elongation factor P [Candidatus Blackburnbacteria bacterium]|nr:elongation factor P [Candidatus Blackburnbacteria bacterium]
MIPITDLRAGTTFLLDGQPYIVLKYTHVKMGRGSATIRVKVRNLKSGATVERTFGSGESVSSISTTKRKLQYLYMDQQNVYFMDPKTYEQVEISKNIMETQATFLKEGAEVDVLFWEDKPLSIDIPNKVTMNIIEAEPGVKGDSASNMYKQAVLENGLRIKVPLFIKTGDRVNVDTRNGEYVERITR